MPDHPITLSCERFAGLAAIGHLKRLRILNLWNCLRISEAGLAVLPHISRVSDLSLRGCQQLSDDVTPALAALPHLRRLDLRACERFTGGPLRLPPQPRALPPLACETSAACKLEQ